MAVGLLGGPVWSHGGAAGTGRWARNGVGAHVPPSCHGDANSIGVAQTHPVGWRCTCGELKLLVFFTRGCVDPGLSLQCKWSRCANPKCTALQLSWDFTLLILIPGILCKGRFLSSVLVISPDFVSTWYLIILALRLLPACWYKCFSFTFLLLA